MAQQGWGAAEPLIGLAKKYYNAFNALNGAPKSNNAPKIKKADTSWHDEMVKEANESFAKQPDASKSKAPRKVAGGAGKRTEIQRNITRKRSTKRVMAKR